MDAAVKKDIITILGETINHVQSGNLLELSSVSNHTIHNAAIFQDEHSLTIAVVIWSISKIARRFDKVDPQILFDIKEAKKHLEADNLEDYFEAIKSVTARIKSLDSKIRYYVQEVINRAQIKKGTKLYDHGISMARASELLGLTQWELMSYIGKTNIADSDESTTGMLKKIKHVRKMFNLP